MVNVEASLKIFLVDTFFLMHTTWKQFHHMAVIWNVCLNHHYLTSKFISSWLEEDTSTTNCRNVGDLVKLLMFIWSCWRVFTADILCNIVAPSASYSWLPSCFFLVWSTFKTLSSIRNCARCTLYCVKGNSLSLFFGTNEQVNKLTTSLAKLGALLKQHRPAYLRLV